jgi:hypothetical protein
MLVALTCTGRSWSFSRIGLGNSPRSRRFSITPLRLRPTRARRRSAGFSWNPPAVRIFIVVFRIERFGQHQSQSSGKHPTARGHIFARRGGGATVPVVLAKKPLPDRRWLDRSRKGCVRARRVGTRVSSRKPRLFQLQPANASRPGEIECLYFVTNVASPRDICTVVANQWPPNAPSHAVDVFGNLGVLLVRDARPSRTRISAFDLRRAK